KQERDASLEHTELSRFAVRSLASLEHAELSGFAVRSLASLEHADSRCTINKGTESCILPRRRPRRLSSRGLRRLWLSPRRLAARWAPSPRPPQWRIT